MRTAIKIYSGLIESHVDYCSAVWDVARSQQVSLIKGTQECWLCPSFLTKTHYTASHESSFSISLNASTRFAVMQRRLEKKQPNKQTRKKKTNERKNEEKTTKALFPARIELVTVRVWGERDNHYTTKTTVNKFSTVYLFYLIWIYVR